MNSNNYYRTYNNGNMISVYFPNGEKYEIDSYDAEYSFRNFQPDIKDDNHFSFSDASEAKEFEDEIRRRAQEHYYNIRRNIFCA